MSRERIVAEAPDEILWVRIARLKSTKLCEELIRNKQKEQGTSLSDELIKKKAVGVSSAVEAAIGYWKSGSDSLNAWILSRYYALLQMTIAEQVASVKNSDDLASIQRHTIFGHGMATISDPSVKFPEGYYSMLLSSGHFSAYLRFLGYDIKDISFNRRLREIRESPDKKNLIPLTDLFRSIPELRSICMEYLNQQPLSFQIAHSTRNHIDRDVIFGKRNPYSEVAHTTSPKSEQPYYTYATILPEGPGVDLAYLQKLELPVAEIEEHEPGSFSGKVFHQEGKLWWDYFTHYKSGYCGTSILSPLLGRISDPIPINVLLLYNLSIICRYLPDLWYEINVGEQNQFHSLIEHYLTVFDRVMPHKMLERISENQISLAMPGSMSAPI